MNIMKIPSQFRNLTLSARQHGLSLVELMISLTIGLFLLLGISTLIVQQNGTRNEMEKSSRQIENGRYAMQLLHDDIQLAGFYGEYSPASGVTMTTPDPCDIADLGWNNNAAAPSVPVPIFGYAGAGADPTILDCLDNYQPDTAVLVIRRTSTTAPTAAATPAPNTTYLQVSTCNSDGNLFVQGIAGFTLRQKDCSTLANLRPYIVRIYYISSCSACTVPDGIPTLKMMEYTGGPALSNVPLVEGIENMQFDYGIDTTGDGSPDSYTTPALAGWANVTSVRVNLLSRNNEDTLGHTDAKTYNLGLSASAVAPGGAYKRHAYSQVVRAINPSGRRE